MAVPTAIAERLEEFGADAGTDPSSTALNRANDRLELAPLSTFGKVGDDRVADPAAERARELASLVGAARQLAYELGAPSPRLLVFHERGLDVRGLVEAFR